MANEAYRVKADVSLPRAIREVEELVNGQKLYETVGVSYNEGDVVLAEDITPPLREKAENGGLDHLLEPISRKEYDEAKEGQADIYIPEHEAEREVLKDAGHQVLGRDQVIELASAGADDAKKAQEDAKGDGADERPNLKLPEVPSLAEVSRGDAEPSYDAAGEAKAEDSALGGGLEKPPGIAVGDDKAALEGGEPAPRKSRPTKKADAPAASESKSE